MGTNQLIKLTARVTAVEILVQHLLLMIVSNKPDPIRALEEYRSRVLCEYEEATVKEVDAFTSDVLTQELKDALDEVLSNLVSRVREGR